MTEQPPRLCSPGSSSRDNSGHHPCAPAARVDPSCGCDRVAPIAASRAQVESQAIGELHMHMQRRFERSGFAAEVTCPGALSWSLNVADAIAGPSADATQKRWADNQYLQTPTYAPPAPFMRRAPRGSIHQVASRLSKRTGGSSAGGHISSRSTLAPKSAYGTRRLTS
jgi:hypothetical protein